MHSMIARSLHPSCMVAPSNPAVSLLAQAAVPTPPPVAPPPPRPWERGSSVKHTQKQPAAQLTCRPLQDVHPCRLSIHHPASKQEGQVGCGPGPAALEVGEEGGPAAIGLLLLLAGQPLLGGGAARSLQLVCRKGKEDGEGGETRGLGWTALR